MQLEGLSVHGPHRSIIERPGDNAVGPHALLSCKALSLMQRRFSRAGSHFTFSFTRHTPLLTLSCPFTLTHVQAPEKMKERDVFKGSHDRQAAAMERNTATASNPTESAQVG